MTGEDRRPTRHSHCQAFNVASIHYKGSAASSQRGAGVSSPRHAIARTWHWHRPLSLLVAPVEKRNSSGAFASGSLFLTRDDSPRKQPLTETRAPAAAGLPALIDCRKLQ